MRLPPAVRYQPGNPPAGTRVTWCGARIVKRMPAAATTSSVSSSTAVSGSHRPSGSRANRRRKSAIPQRTSVTLSRRELSGRIVWWNGMAIALPWPVYAATLARSAASTAVYVTGA